ncbi:transglycosylase SLT domain-containing protein [Pseudonocardia xishanensis]|uniref:Transglycosylase SLT domain-containing protein n=1 Tax=Pseudonocardia xishanensis TaxID=630995 RepID=A0ABP8S4E2_9PSEU
MPAHHAARHATAPRGRAAGRSVASSTAAVGAAFGVLATGTFAAVTSGGAGQAVADAAETAGTSGTSTVATTLAANEAALPVADTAADGAHVTPAAFGLGDLDAGEDFDLSALDKAGKIADAIAAQQAKEAEAQAAKQRLAAVISQGGLDGWIAEALDICDLPQSLAPSVKKIIMAESGGNPRAINTWDSNAQRGTPSQGLMQTIPSTFRAYVHPSLAGSSITDPVANITAGLRYMIANYGLGTVQAGGRSNHAGDYVGY